MSFKQSPFLKYPSKNNSFQVLFHPYQSSWIIVNKTASDIINQFFNNKSFGEIANKLSSEFEIDNQQALKDVNNVYENLIEKKFDKKNIETYKQRKPDLKSLFLHITRRCNLKCPHCYVGDSDSSIIDLPKKVIFELIDELINNGGNGLTISGGEPLLHPDINKILLYASKKLTVRLLTNGTKINSTMAKFIADNNIYVQISLDGSTEALHDSIRGTGSYKKILRAIEELQKYNAGNKLNLCTTLMKKNQSDWKQMINFAEKNEILLHRFLHLREIGRANNHPMAQALTSNEYEKFISHISKLQRDKQQKIELTCGMSGLLLKMPEEFQTDDIWCPVGRMVVIDTNGDAFPCVLLMRDKYRLGNIYDQNIIEISKAKPMKDICGILVKRRHIIEKCRCCSFKNLCQAGCMGQALDHNNSVMTTDDFCQYRQKAYADSFDHLLQMADKR